MLTLPPLWVLTLTPPAFLIQGQVAAGHPSPTFFSGKSGMLVWFLLSSSSKIYLGLFLCFLTCSYIFLSFFMHLQLHITFEFTIYDVLCRLDACSFFSLVLLKPLFPSSLVCISLTDLWFRGLVSPGAA